MARVHPFPGLRYDVQKVGSLSRVVSPPYDVITPKEAELLLARSPYNAVHVDLTGQQAGSDDLGSYEQAGLKFRAWIAAGVLQAEERPALYLYRQTYAIPGTGQRRQVLGFVAAVELAEFRSGVVLPHEHTFPKPKADRLQLMRATKANLSPVYGFYSEPRLELEAVWERLSVGPAQAAALDEAGSRHEMWVVTEREAIAAAQRVLEPLTVFIADGHHRYETALDYRREQVGEGRGRSGPWDRVMMMLVNLDAGGLTILPTHRVLHGLPMPDLAALRRSLAELFEVHELSASREGSWGEQLQQGTIGAYVAPGRAWLLRRRDQQALRSAIPDDRSQAWKDLDVTVLHRLVLERILGLSPEAIDQQRSIAYTRDAAEACGAVERGEATAAFLLPAPSVQAVRDIALAGDVMPHKSTYFYPKLLTGLVFADLATARSG